MAKTYKSRALGNLTVPTGTDRAFLKRNFPVGQIKRPDGKKGVRMGEKMFDNPKIGKVTASAAQAIFQGNDVGIVRDLAGKKTPGRKVPMYNRFGKILD